MFDITYNIAKNSVSFFDIVSIISPMVVGLCTIYFMGQQVSIQKKQQKTKIFHLRVEHIQFLLNIWKDYNTYIYSEKEHASIILNGNNAKVIVLTMKKAAAELLKHNLVTNNLFDEEIYNLEKNFIERMFNIIPTEVELYENIQISSDYINLKSLFNELYDKYENILNKEGIL